MSAVRELALHSPTYVAALDDKRAAFIKECSRELSHVPQENISKSFDMFKNSYDEIDRIIESFKDESGVFPEDLEPMSEAMREPLSDLYDRVSGLISDPSSERILTEAWYRADDRPSRSTVMYSALFLSAVSNFELIVGKCIRATINAFPGIVSKSEKQYTFKEISTFPSIDEFREHCSDLYADQIMRGGFEDWIKWFSENQSVSSSNFLMDELAVRELFQRRHLIVHNGGIVNKIYLSKLPGLSDKPDLNMRLVVDQEYVLSAIDKLQVSGVLLCIKVQLKLTKPDDDSWHPAYYLASSESYEHLLSGRLDAAIALSEKAREFCAHDSTSLILKVNNWIGRKNLHGASSIKGEVEAWQVNTLAPRFRLAKFALLEKHDYAVRLVGRMVESNELSRQELATWPLLAGIRDYITSSTDHGSLRTLVGNERRQLESGDDEMDR